MKTFSDCFRVAVVLAPMLATAAVGCAGADETDADSAASALGDATGSDTPTPTLTFADVLAGGRFRCAEPGRGDVVMSLTPSAPTDGARSKASLSGRVASYDYPPDDAPMDLEVHGSELSGRREINDGDIGHSYYCGGGVAAYNCGPDRTDGVRVWDQHGQLRCEITLDRGDGPLAVHAQLVRAVAPPPSMFGRNVSGHDVLRVASTRWPGNNLSGMQVTLPTSMALQQFGVVAVRPTTMPLTSNVTMALYADVQGHPGALVASTAATPVAGGDQQIPPLTPTTLPAGSYWLMMEFDQATSIWGTNESTTFATAWVSHTFGTPLPTDFPAPPTIAVPDNFPGLHMGRTPYWPSFYILAQASD